MPDVRQEWLSASEAAIYTGRHAKTITNAARRGYLLGYQSSGVNGSWRFKVADLDRWMRGERPARRRAVPA